ncbi:MAG TPA: 4Fe-4S double cluster binding domain-containing protein, partial [Clostridia bacterium]|nr:4Fe-4S double cluster binding domain-containing protein [Clostridia bacterium]
LSNGSLDARKCISYLTIENKNEIPAEFQNQLSGCALGCDICADVCPWNHKWAKPHIHPELSPLLNVLDWNTKVWEQLTEIDFNQVFRNSALKRAGFSKLKQNIEVVLKLLKS